MTAKLTLQRFFWIVFAALLAACTPAQPSLTGVQSTAIAAAYTGVALTQTALPTATLPSSTFTPTLEFMPVPATVIPTQPPFIPFMTPDAIQVERWQEYQTELAKGMFAADNADPIKDSNFGPEEYKDALCEWDILGEEKQVVFVYAVCIASKYFYFGSTIAQGAGSIQNLAAIFLESDGSIRNVVVPDVTVSHGDLADHYDFHLFPLDVQKKLCEYYFYDLTPQCLDVLPDYQPYQTSSRFETFYQHLFYRVNHLDEPPLVVLSAMPTATSTP